MDSRVEYATKALERMQLFVQTHPVGWKLKICCYEKQLSILSEHCCFNLTKLPISYVMVISLGGQSFHQIYSDYLDSEHARRWMLMRYAEPKNLGQKWDKTCWNNNIPHKPIHHNLHVYRRQFKMRQDRDRRAL